MAGSFITSILSMLATLAIAYGIDRWINVQQRAARQNFTFPQAYTWVIVGGLVMLLLWLVLSWLVLVKNRRTPAVAIIYIVAGLLAFAWYPLEFVSRFWAEHLWLFTFQVNNFQYSGLFIAVLGVLGVLTLLMPDYTPKKLSP